MIRFGQPFERNNTIYIYGKVLENANRSDVYIYRGFENDENSQDIALHIILDFLSGWMTVFSVEDGVESVNKVIAVPFVKGKEFVLQIRNLHWSFMIMKGDVNYVTLQLNTSSILGNVRTTGDWIQNKITMTCSYQDIFSVKQFPLAPKSAAVPDLDCNVINADFSNKIVHLITPFKVNMSLWFWGKSWKNPKTAEVMLYSGYNNTLTSRNIVFHLQFEYLAPRQMKMNSMNSEGAWVNQQTALSPYFRGLPFAVQLRRTSVGIEYWAGTVYHNLMMKLDPNVVIGNVRTRGDWDQYTTNMNCPRDETIASSTTTTEKPSTTTKSTTTTTTTVAPSVEKDSVIVNPETTLESSSSSQSNPAKTPITCSCPTSNSSSSSDSTKLLKILKSLPKITIFGNDYEESGFESLFDLASQNIDEKLVEVLKNLRFVVKKPERGDEILKPKGDSGPENGPAQNIRSQPERDSGKIHENQECEEESYEVQEDECY